MQLSLFNNEANFLPSPPAAMPDFGEQVDVTVLLGSHADLVDAADRPPGVEPAMTTFTSTGEAIRLLPINLAEVLDALPTLPLSPSRLRDMRSALKTVSRVVGLPLAEITTDVRVLGPMLAKAAPAVGLVKPKRWAAVRSHTQSALRAVGFDILPSRDGVKREADDVSRAWGALEAALPTMRLRNGLSRMRRYFVRAGVAPDEVTLKEIEAFRTALLDTSLLKHPATIYGNSVHLWNIAAETVAGWPQLPIPKPPNPRHYSLAWSAFPLPFRDEVEAYLADGGNRDVTADDYAPSVRPVTLDGRRSRLRRAASALSLSGFPTAEITSLEVLTRPANVKAAARFLLDRKKGPEGNDQPSDDLANIVDLLRIVAKYWLKDSDRATALARLTSNLRPKRSGMTQKNRSRLLQFDSEQNQLALLRLPERVLKDVRKRDRGDKADALRVMWAVAVEILIMAPMRVKSLIALQPGRQFVQIGKGRQTHRHIIIPKEETKTNVAFEMRLPDESCAIVDEYLAKYRSRICKGSTPYLFPNARGEQRSAIFSTHLARFIWKETGLRVNPHLFRHLAGKFYLQDHPQEIETVRQFLSHKSTGTTERAYVEVRAEQAFRNLDALILNRRDEASRIQRVGPRKPRSRR